MAEDNSDFERRSQRWLSRKRRRSRIPSETLNAYTAYLDAPHSHGYWRLTAKWLTDGRVQQFLIKSLIS
jgi:hypothetical protein